MRRHLLAAILLLALAGLTFIQFRLLVSGMRLEKLRFDYRTAAAFNSVGKILNEPNQLSDALISFLTRQQTPFADTVFLAKTLDSLVAAELQKRDVSARFTFALTEINTRQAFLASPDFKKDGFAFGRHVVPLGSRIAGVCRCERALHLDTQDLFSYLLGELTDLVFTSVLCLLAILLCLALLVGTLRKEQKLNLVKNDFINNLTHELKTPSFSISLSAKLAKENIEKGEPQKAIQFLQLLEKENEKLKIHVEKVLELASLESSRFNLQKAPTDFHELIRETLAEFSSQAESRQGRLSASFRATDFRLTLDKIHFQNALRNLLDNALKYCEKAPEIEVSTESDGKHFRLAVRDNGIGIAPAQQRLVFDKFYRAPAGNLHFVKGFGLGLSYVKQIVTAHGGRIFVESKVGEGAVFSVVLPFR